MSSLDRWQKDKSKNIRGLGKKDAAQRFLTRFREEIEHLGPDVGAHTNEQFLSLAQHYGVPTRFLDWTESPYIAAFFAFSGIVAAPTENEPVAIWCLDTSDPVWREDTGATLLSVPCPYNERLKAQLGKFLLLQSPFDTLEAHIQQCDSRGRPLRKIMLPATEARAALADLDFMGISYSTIYLGLDGCARAAELRVLLEQ